MVIVSAERDRALSDSQKELKGIKAEQQTWSKDKKAYEAQVSAHEQTDSCHTCKDACVPFACVCVCVHPVYRTVKCLTVRVYAVLCVWVQVEHLQRKVADLESSLASKEQAAKQVSHESARYGAH